MKNRKLKIVILSFGILLNCQLFSQQLEQTSQFDAFIVSSENEILYQEHNNNVNSTTSKEAIAPQANLISEKHQIKIDADVVIGELYNLWDTRVYTKAEKWLDKEFAQNMKSSSKDIKYMNNVRSLGGKDDKTCEWFKGVDDKGEPICDFAPYLKILKNQMAVGFTPMIVLDNVPTKMSNAPFYKYGNCSPPADYQLWFKYIQKFMQALVDEFGLEQVSSWRFRVGTEPDLFPNHWAGTKEEFFKHYDYTVAAVETIIKKPIIGPGNILMFRDQQEDGKGGRWGFDLIQHCAEGVNNYTGKKGTRVSFISQSIYANTPKSFEFEDNAKRVRAEMDKYPIYKNATYEIHEFGEIKDALGNGDAVSLTAFFAGLYAHTAEVSYTQNVQKIFSWGLEASIIPGLNNKTGNLPLPWTKVRDCLIKMEGGQRVKVDKDSEKALKQGCISAWNNGNLYFLVYSHHDDFNQNSKNSINLNIVGKQFSKGTSWSIDEQLLDKDNGVYVDEIYKDIEQSGIKPLAAKFKIQRAIRQRYGIENAPAAVAIAKSNLKKYQKMSEMTQIRSKEKIKLTDNNIEINLEFEGSGFRFIKLTAVK